LLPTFGQSQEDASTKKLIDTIETLLQSYLYFKRFQLGFIPHSFSKHDAFSLEDCMLLFTYDVIDIINFQAAL